MKKEFIERVIAEWVVDTKKYRYIYDPICEIAYIKRLRRSLIGTTAAYGNWEVVKKWRARK